MTGGIKSYSLPTNKIGSFGNILSANVNIGVALSIVIILE